MPPERTPARSLLDLVTREIIEAERPESPADRRGTREWAAVFLILFGFIAAGVGWVGGVILLWRSRAWTTRDKLIGTLVLPRGLLLSVPLRDTLFSVSLGSWEANFARTAWLDSRRPRSVCSARCRPAPLKP